MTVWGLQVSFCFLTWGFGALHEFVKWKRLWVVMILSLIGGDRCCWRLAAFGWSSSCFSIIIRQRAAPLVITSFPSLFPYTVFALKTSNRGLIFFHTIFIPFMTLAQWHKTFMAPFHTLISDVIFSLFCLDWILTWLSPVVFSLEHHSASIQQVTWAAFAALVLSPNYFYLQCLFVCVNR